MHDHSLPKLHNHSPVVPPKPPDTQRIRLNLDHKIYAFNKFSAYVCSMFLPMKEKFVKNIQHQQLDKFLKVSYICRPTKTTNVKQEKYDLILVIWRNAKKIIRKMWTQQYGFQNAFYCRLFHTYSAPVCNYYQL